MVKGVRAAPNEEARRRSGRSTETWRERSVPGRPLGKAHRLRELHSSHAVEMIFVPIGNHALQDGAAPLVFAHDADRREERYAFPLLREVGHQSVHVVEPEPNLLKRAPALV